MTVNRGPWLLVDTLMFLPDSWLGLEAAIAHRAKVRNNEDGRYTILADADHIFVYLWATTFGSHAPILLVHESLVKGAK